MAENGALEAVALTVDRFNDFYRRLNKALRKLRRRLRPLWDAKYRRRVQKARRRSRRNMEYMKRKGICR